MSKEVVYLSRKNPDDKLEIDLSLDELDITAAESKATCEEKRIMPRIITV